MKKIFTLVLCLFMIFSFSINVHAICTNEGINEWATKIEVKFTEMHDHITYEENGEVKQADFAYILSVTPQRDDVKIIVTDGDGAKAEAKKYKIDENTEIYGVGCYTNLEDETYIINVYGNTPDCNNELLRTMKYTVPRFNEFIKNAKCEGSDSELCKTFTDSTKDMSVEEFDKLMGDAEEDSSFGKILGVLKEYGLYVLIPLVIVSIIYIIRIKKYRHEERNK